MWITAIYRSKNKICIDIFIPTEGIQTFNQQDFTVYFDYEQLLENFGGTAADYLLDKIRKDRVARRY